MGNLSALLRLAFLAWQICEYRCWMAEVMSYPPRLNTFLAQAYTNHMSDQRFCQRPQAEAAKGLSCFRELTVSGKEPMGSIQEFFPLWHPQVLFRGHNLTQSCTIFLSTFIQLTRLPSSREVLLAGFSLPHRHRCQVIINLPLYSWWYFVKSQILSIQFCTRRWHS